MSPAITFWFMAVLMALDTLITTAASAAFTASAQLARAQQVCSRTFGYPLTLIDATTGQTLFVSDKQPTLPPTLDEVCRAVARLGRVEFLADEDPLALLAIPLPVKACPGLVAVGAFVTRAADSTSLSVAARILQLDPAATASLIHAEPWKPETLQRSATIMQALWLAETRVSELQTEVSNISQNLVATYEEISLLYRLTQNLKLSSTDEDLGRLALEWLADVVPARGFAIQYLPVAGAEKPGVRARTEPLLITHGVCSLDSGEFTRLVEHLDLTANSKAKILNPPATSGPLWPFAEISELVAVPLTEGNNIVGYLGVLNHQQRGAEFGTIEGNLLGSVAAILGIHSGNIELYRQQAELLSGVVRALTSAIDAKDPYTCGHSDRVARIAVRLAQELNCDQHILDTIYMAGLLHDIGKIGIDDNVLRKPGKLSDTEYEHIKTHVEIGYRILLDLRQLDEVLPVVRHHHESWNGGGYPLGLEGSQIPLMARIVGVADAFDAMSSDRPYRKGMPDEKLDAILREGAGSQWDAAVIDAFFRARDDIRQIVHREPQQLPLDLHQWV